MDEIARAISTATGTTFAVRRQRAVGGGCIHRALVVEDGPRRYFVKLNDAGGAAMFEAEAHGLAAIAATDTVRVPRVVARGLANGEAFLVLEYLDLCGGGDARVLGRQLAALHRATGPHYGWPRDNFIGATPQINTPEQDWPRFYATRRLQPQIEWARDKGCPPRLHDEGMRLAQRVGEFFDGYRPQPSLLHGDLWGGNAALLADGTPVVFDPATYWGDREADIAMTELFGGFSGGFQAAYRDTWPLDAGYPVRKTLYNLYHVVNHFNLFGGGYAEQAQGMVQRLLAEIGG